MPNFFDTLKDLIYKPKQKYLTPEEAQVVAENVRKTLVTMRSNSSWAQVQVNAAIKLAQDCPKDNPRYQHYRRVLKLRLVMQQYFMKMELAMESISSQIELAQMSAEMGEALTGATQLVSTYKRDMPSFTGFVRDFMKTITPMNDALNGGLDEMTAALDELTGCSLDGIYSDADLDRLISGEAATIEPTIPTPPVVQAQPEAKPAAQPISANDLLASIEATMGRFHSDDK